MMTEMDLTKAIVDIFRFGESDEWMCNEDLVVFSHPKYFMRADPTIGHLYEEYAKAFVVFTINYN